MLKLVSWGLRPWTEFTLDPTDWSYSTRRLAEAPGSYDGTAGFAQEITVAGRGTMLLAVFVHAGEIQLLLGTRTIPLFTPGLKLEHRRGAVFSQLRITPPGGETETYSYRRTNLLLAFIDSTFDDLDIEVVHLAASLPALATRDPIELLEEWSIRAKAAPDPALVKGVERDGAAKRPSGVNRPAAMEPQMVRARSRAPVPGPEAS
jgi:hypothetical protein